MNKLILNDNFITQLLNTPETGMGYHIVDITLDTGEILKKRFVFNCEYLQLNDNEKIINNIIKIKLNND